jgi:hypothetical protein
MLFSARISITAPVSTASRGAWQSTRFDLSTVSWCYLIDIRR